MQRGAVLKALTARLHLPPEDQPRLRVFAITVWLAVGMLTLAVVLDLLGELHALALIDGVCLAVAVRTMRHLHDPQRAVTPFLWTLTFTLSLGSLATTPTDPIILCYLFVLPLVCANVLDVQQTRVWFFRVMGAGSAALVAGRLGWSWPETVAEPLLKELSSFVGALVGIMALLTSLARQSAHAEERLREAERAKTAFFANLGHEIRTPMNGVLGMTDALLLRPLPPGELEMVQTIQASGMVMLQLVDDLLDYSKLEAGRLVLREGPVDLRSLAGELLSLWRPLAERKQLDLAVHVDPALPRVLVLDGLRLRQILNNLLSNAIKFTEVGSVTVRLDRVDGRLRCAIEDTGIGIQPLERERLFGRFVQADDARARQYQGAGLGLVLSRELARLMGGTLEVSSSPGQGSCFTCVLPLVPAIGPAAAAPARAEVPPGLKVLVVDDNAVNRLVAQRLLERCGCLVAVSADGRDALTALQAQRDYFDVVLMDVHMPGLDGLETTRLVRASHGQRLRIIGCSASAESADLESCREAGMDDFLAKPVTRERLVQTLLRSGST